MPQGRIRFQPNTSSGGGGGGPGTTVGLLSWGPDFGEEAGNDDTTWDGLGFANDGFDTITLTNDCTLGLQNEGLTELSLVNDSGLGAGLDLSDVDFAGDSAFGLESGASTFNPSGYAEHNYITVPYMHYKKTTTGDFYGFVVLDQDGGSTTRAAIARGNTNSYLFNGADPTTTGDFSIFPETVAGISEDERRAYFKFPTSQLETTGNGDMLPLDSPNGWVDGVSFGFYVEATNPAVASDAIITFTCYASTTNPWDNTSSTYDDVGDFYPAFHGSPFLTRTDTIVAGDTSVVGFEYNFNISNVLDSKWIWIEVTSDLPELTGPVKLRPFHASGQPNDYIGDFQAGVIFFNATMWQT